MLLPQGSRRSARKNRNGPSAVRRAWWEKIEVGRKNGLQKIEIKHPRKNRSCLLKPKGADQERDSGRSGVSNPSKCLNFMLPQTGNLSYLFLGSLAGAPGKACLGISMTDSKTVVASERPNY